MASYYIAFLLSAIGEHSVLNAGENSTEIRALLTDSRQVVGASTTVFFAIAGERHDGHEFLLELYSKGCRVFIVEKHLETSSFADAWIILVSNATIALQNLAAVHRKEFHIPVVGITGSNGKTIVKEYVAQLLEQVAIPVRNPHSYNSQIGVPLSVWGIQSRHNVGIFEAGISNRGEMLALEKVICPTVGLFTNIGSAHDEGFEDRAEKIREKSILFQSVETLIYCKQHTLIHEYVSEKYVDKKLLTWKIAQRHLSGHADKNAEISFLLALELNGKLLRQDRILLPYYDDATLENAIHAAVLADFLFPERKSIQEWAAGLAPLDMRMQRVQGINGSIVIDDSYSLDLAGLEVALRKARLWREQVGGRFTVILSDFAEAGKNPEHLYQEVLELLRSVAVDQVFVIGRKIGTYLIDDTIPIKSYFSIQDFLKSVHLQDFQREVILVKGARNFGFDAIARFLSVSQHSTRLEIDLDAITHNLNYYRSLLKSETKVMAMVKAFAYGSGSFEVAKLLQYQLVDYLAVAYAQEGIDLRNKGIIMPIMVMNSGIDELAECVKNGLEPVVFSFAQVSELERIVLAEKRVIGIHIECDTGMSRLGFSEEEELNTLLEAIKRIGSIEVKSVFSHLAGADSEEHDSFSRKQIEKFYSLASFVELNLGYVVIKHILNSPGIIRFADAQMDMVRLGIGLYGIEPNAKFQDQLKTVTTFKTTISQIHELQAGESVGYNRAFIADKPVRIATIPVGYADGYRRSLSKGVGQVRVNGSLAPIAGMVCMDMTMIDLTGIEAKAGDEVVLFDEVLTVTDLAEKLGTIPYEVLTNIHERVKRVFISA